MKILKYQNSNAFVFPIYKSNDRIPKKCNMKDNRKSLKRARRESKLNQNVDFNLSLVSGKLHPHNYHRSITPCDNFLPYNTRQTYLFLYLNLKITF